MGIKTSKDKQLIDSSMLQIAMILILFVLLVISLTNLRNFKKLGNYPAPDHYPCVSILVPARNEEGKISLCINSLLAQNYTDFEIIVLLDQSTDGTENILREIAAKNKRLRILTGKALSPIWLGKHWACHQMAQAAKGELLLFTDADTIHKPDSLRESVAAMMAENADLLTALPEEKVSSLFEKIILPLMPFGVSSVLPIKIAHNVKSPLLSITIGQFMLFRRKAYEKIGGYSAVRDNIADDMAMGRRIKANGLRLFLVDGSEYISCHMYDNYSQISEGFSKNLFTVFGCKVIPYILIWVSIALIFLNPLSTLILKTAGVYVSGESIKLSIVAIFLTILLFGNAYKRFNYPLIYILFYPICVSLWFIMAMNSMILTILGKTTWKERRLIKPVVRWF